MHQRQLYLLTRSEEVGIDEYGSAIVCAENGHDARRIHPDGRKADAAGGWDSSTWAINVASVSATLIGVADPSVPVGVVLPSFNAGR